jgi:hypothetical protein
MKTLTLVGLAFTLVSVSMKTFGQPTISSAVSATVLVCPGQLTPYQISFPDGLSQCSINWSIEDGIGNFFNGVTTGASVSVTWQDQRPNKVTVQAIVRYRATSGGSCSEPEEVILTFTHILRSVLQESLTDVGTSAEVPYCETQPVVTLSVGVMNIKNTGGAGQPPLTEVERYEWTIPAGWKGLGTPNTGMFYTPRIIQIEPTNPEGICSASGG